MKGMPPQRWDFSHALAQGFVSLLGRAPAPEELQAFSRYLALLLKWNRAQRLTGYRSAQEITSKLFLDSLRFLRWIEPGDEKVLDLGAGPGIPGIPLKIVEPRIHLTLLEARRRRVSFLATVVRELGFTDVRLLHGRAEVLSESEPGVRGAFDVVVTRGAGPLRSIVPIALAFLRPGGRFIGSGPPIGNPTPSLHLQAPHRWESFPALGGIGGRRFLIAEKT